MKILLGDFKTWRIKRVIAFLLVMTIAILILKFLNIENYKFNTAIIIIFLFSIGLAIDSRIFRIEYITDYSENDRIIYIHNKKIDYKINKDDIIEVYNKEVFYGGRWLKVIGFQLIIVCKNRTYIFDSPYKENCIWEETDLYKIENSIKKFIRNKY